MITKCSIQTSDDVKVAEVAWASATFIAEFGYATPYPKAPEPVLKLSRPLILNRKLVRKWSFI